VRAALATPLLALILATGSARASGTGTLLVYDALAKPFSMEDAIEPLAILLSQFEPAVQRRAAKDLRPADLEAAGRFVIVGTGGFPVLDPDSLEVLKTTKKPLLAVGGAAPLALGESPRNVSAPNRRATARSAISASAGPRRWIRGSRSRWTARASSRLWFPEKPRGPCVSARETGLVSPPCQQIPRCRWCSRTC